MGLFQKVDRLLAQEIISLTSVITAGVSSIMIIAKLPRYADFLFSSPEAGTTFLMLLLYIFPSILKLTIPVSLLLSCAICFMRMSADRELEAWLAGGAGILRLSLTPLCLGIFVMLLSLLSALFFEPYSNRQFDRFKWMQTRSVVEAVLKSAIKEKSFIRELPVPQDTDVSMYFDTVSRDKSSFTGVLVFFKLSNWQHHGVILSRSGTLGKSLNAGYPDYIFSLQDGMMIIPGQNQAASYDKSPSVTQEFSSGNFKRADLSLVNLLKNKFKIDPSLTGGADQLYPREYLAMLERQKRENSQWRTDKNIINKHLFFLKQISVPVSTLFLPVIGVCIGIRDPRRKQYGMYFAVGIVIFLLYASLSLCQQLALHFVISPFWILAATPAVLAAMMVLLLSWRLRHPPSTSFLSFLQEDLLAFPFSFLKRIAKK